MNSGYISSTAGTVQMAPLLSTPNVALSGSGTPTGAPPALGVNDLRGNAVGSVYVPGSVSATTTGQTAFSSPAVVSGGTAAAAPAGPNAVAGANAATAPAAPMGIMTSFIPDSRSRPAASAAAPVSLGELAAQFRSKRKPQPVQSDRVYTNNDILAMGNTATFRGQTVDLPQSDVANPEPDEDSPAANPRRQSRDLQRESDNKGVLDARDLSAVEAAIARSKKRQQQSHPPQPR
jgi:hypothetical protein